MGRKGREQKSQRKQNRKNAHKRIPENYHRYVWNGKQFASKLEIAWAFFFDGLRIRWQYESRTVFLYKGTLDVIAYTPDFWLPEHDLFVEVKGRVLMPKAVQRMERTAYETGHPVILAQGSPSRALNPQIPDTGLLMKHPSLSVPWGEADLSYCPECRSTEFHRIGVVRRKGNCPHDNDNQIGRSAMYSIAGKRIPDSAIHLLSRKVNEL